MILFVQICFRLRFRFVYSFFSSKKIYVDKKANYAVKVSGIKISPDPVVSGEPANFKISATSGNLLSFSSYLAMVFKFQSSFLGFSSILVWFVDNRAYHSITLHSI